MAVAAHVSRVSKEYAPYGYSIMQDLWVTVGRLEGDGDLAATIATSPVAVSMLPLDDADVYIESVQVFMSAKVGTHDGSNAFNFFVKRADNDGSLSNAVELASGGAKRTDGIALTTNVDMGVDQNQVVEKGKVFYIAVVEHGDVSALAVDGLSFLVRYRRKA
jgi:hypothetical protein